MPKPGSPDVCVVDSPPKTSVVSWRRPTLAMSAGKLAALLRRERLYSSQLVTWRTQLEQQGESGLQAKKPGRKPLKDARTGASNSLRATRASSSASCSLRRN